MLYENSMQPQGYGFAAREQVDRQSCASNNGTIGAGGLIPPSTPAPHHGFRRSGAGLFQGSCTREEDTLYSNDLLHSGSNGSSEFRTFKDSSVIAKKTTTFANGVETGFVARMVMVNDLVKDDLYSFSDSENALPGNPIGRQQNPVSTLPTGLCMPSSKSLEAPSAALEAQETGGSALPRLHMFSNAVEVGAGLSAAQTTRFSNYMKGSSLTHRQAQLKMLELLQYWITSPGVRPCIDHAVQEAMHEADHNRMVVKLAWGKSDKPSALRPAAPAEGHELSAAAATLHVNEVECPCGESSPSNTVSFESPYASSTAARSKTVAPRPSPTRTLPPTLQTAPEPPSDDVAQHKIAPSRTPSVTPLSTTPQPQPPLGMVSPRRRTTCGQCDEFQVPTEPASLLVKGNFPAARVAESEEPTLLVNETQAPPSRLRCGASYDEIPRFYFPLGKPTTRENVLSGPLSKQLQNPHLKITEDLTLMRTIIDGGEAVNSSLLHQPSTDATQRPTPTATPMSTLRCLDEKHTHQYIDREFMRIPPSPKRNLKVRLVSGRTRSYGVLSHAKQETNYRNRLAQCLQRVCMHAFGVPRYFAYIVMGLIQSEVAGRSPEIVNPSTSAPGSRFLSGTPAGSGGSCFVITAQHVKDFYDAQLKNKSSLRRTFDLLILSSRLEQDGRDDSAAQVKGSTAADPTSLRPFLLAEDFVAYLNALLVHHPGLSFLKNTPDFHAKYLDTVLYRIFYEVDRLDRGRISFAEFSFSRLMDAFRQVDASDDINAVLLFFSYEHFYVLYCRFWELDENRDMMLSPTDFAKYAPEDVMNPLVMQRVFAGAGRRVRCPVKGFIGYEDFVWYCLSEEDKSSPAAIRYWFRLLDLDGDGLLSLYELRTFYDATQGKLSEYVPDGGTSFAELVSQLFDMMRCPVEGGLRLQDFMRDPEATYVVINMITNVVRFLQFEQRDPFVFYQERLLGGVEQSPWDRFARVEYDRMAQEADE